jgi:hypothetical protein
MTNRTALVIQQVCDSLRCLVRNQRVSRFILQRVIDQLDGFVAAKPAENVFVMTFDTRIAALGSAVSAEVTSLFTQSYGRVVGLRNP